ncbi:MAG: sensor histidine kinase [Chitinophagaceae bacterium]
MRSGLLLFFLLISCNHLPAQAPGNKPTENIEGVYRKLIDSMPFFIATGLTTPVNLKRQCHLPGHLQYINSRYQVYFSEKALHLKEEEKDAYARTYALFDKFIKSYTKKDYSSSNYYCQQALDIAVAHDFSFEELHLCRPSLNNSYFLSGDYTNAMKISSAGLSKAGQVNDTNRMAHFNNVIGYIHMRQKNFVQAAQYFQLNLQLCRSLNDTLSEAGALCNLAELCIARGQYDTAISFLQAAEQTYRSMKDVSFFTPKEREAYVSNNMAEAYKLKGACRQALAFALNAASLAGSRLTGMNLYDKASYYINTGAIYNCLSNPDSAVFFLRQGIRVAKSIIHREYIRDAAEQLAIAFAGKKIFDSAYFYHFLFARLKDSINAETSQQEILQREASLKIEQQRQLQQSALEQQKLWRNIVIAISLFALITLGFLYNRYRLRQKNRYQQEMNQQQNELFNAIAATQDQERKRIAEDLHDSLGSILSAAKLKLSALKESQPAMSVDQLANYHVAMQLLDEASVELRNISHNIMPATLSKLGLVAALRNLINQITSHAGIQIYFSSHGFEQRLDEHSEMSIYRIVLELINNVIKHAEASKVTVQLIRHPEYINLSVEDNGRGFDYENALKIKKGSGLGNILSRVEYLKGGIDVDTVPGRGTTVIIDIPYTIA